MGFLNRLRRPDWLGELQWVLVVGLVLMALVAVFIAVDYLRGGAVTVDLWASGVTGTVDTAEAGLPAGAGIAAEQDLRVEIAEPSLGQQVAALLTHVPSFVVVVALLVLLLRIVRQARRTDPFTLATVRRLRVLAVVALAGGLGAFLVELFAGFHLAGTVGVPQTGFYLGQPLVWLLVGFGLFAVAEVVKRGCVLRDELDTVV